MFLHLHSKVSIPRRHGNMQFLNVFHDVLCFQKQGLDTVMKTVPKPRVGGYCPGHTIVLKLADRMTSDCCILY